MDERTYYDGATADLDEIVRRLQSGQSTPAQVAGLSRMGHELAVGCARRLDTISGTPTVVVLGKQKRRNRPRRQRPARSATARAAEELRGIAKPMQPAADAGQPTANAVPGPEQPKPDTAAPDQAMSTVPKPKAPEAQPPKGNATKPADPETVAVLTSCFMAVADVLGESDQEVTIIDLAQIEEIGDLYTLVGDENVSNVVGSFNHDRLGEVLVKTSQMLVKLAASRPDFEGRFQAALAEDGAEPVFTKLATLLVQKL